jgi:hypothetical protein
MRFLFGVALGFGIGFAGAVLLAPDKKKAQQDWLPPGARGAAPGNGYRESGVKGLVASLKERVGEALEEARQAQREAEREMQERYERSVGRK